MTIILTVLRFCGTSLRGEILTLYNTVHLLFTSDGSHNAPGFKIHYQRICPGSGKCFRSVDQPVDRFTGLLIDGGPKYYIDNLQRLQFRGIQIIYLYLVNGREIASSDEVYLHNHLNLSFLETRRKRHLLTMMFDLKTRRPDLILGPKQNSMNLRSNRTIIFYEELVNYELYGKSHYIRGVRLWKKLTCELQHAGNKTEFSRLLTNDIIQHL